MERNYFVYLMTNASRVVLYTGMTNHLERRVRQHQNGECPDFTKRYRVDRLVHYETDPYVLNAIAREKEIKGWTRAKKNVLVETLNPRWKDLSVELFGAPGGSRDPALRSG